MSQQTSGVFYWLDRTKGTTVQFEDYKLQRAVGKDVAFRCVVNGGEWQLVTDKDNPPDGIQLGIASGVGLKLVGVPVNTGKTDGIDPIISGVHASKP